MLIQSGKRYIRRDGSVTVLPLVFTGRDTRYPFNDESFSYTTRGRVLRYDFQHQYDLVYEVGSCTLLNRLRIFGLCLKNTLSLSANNWPSN